MHASVFKGQFKRLPPTLTGQFGVQVVCPGDAAWPTADQSAMDRRTTALMADRGLLLHPPWTLPLISIECGRIEIRRRDRRTADQKEAAT